jgi:RHS repeat-associated protein
MRTRLGKLLLLIGLVGIWTLGMMPPAEAQSWSNGYAFRRAITIDHTKVPNTDQANFPVLISGTYPYLATTSNGGDVTSSSGYDIIFTSDSAGTNVLPLEQESYSPSTGAVNYWVKVASLSHVTDTVVYMFYGNGSVAADQSNKTGVWDANYVGVWHLANANGLSAKDSTNNANDGTITGAAPVSGQVDGAASFSGSAQYIDVGNKTSLQVTGNSITLESWVNTSESSPSQWKRIIAKELPGNADPYVSYSLNRVANTNLIGIGISHGGSGTNVTANSASSLTMGAWAHVVGTYDGSSLRLYFNGHSDAQTSTTGSIINASQNVVIGADTAASTEYFTGSLDEVRISNVARSADWIAAEYNSQSNPAAFYSVSTPVVNGLGTSTAPYIAGSSPSSGRIATVINILGANFGPSQGSSTLTFNGTAGVPAVWTDSAIVVPVPYGATTGNIVVTVSGVQSNGTSFTVTPIPPISNGYAFRRAITIDHTKVPNTDQANFPVLISGTYPYLATASNGGDVTSSSGYDIIFTSDSAGTNVLPFEQESYSPSTGAVNYWVKIASLSHVTDTVVYVFYGNGSVTTDQSNKTGVWDANYKGVWHLANGITLNANDSTSNGNNGTVNGNISAFAGKIGGAASATGGTNNSISTTNSITADSNPFTYSFWVNSAGGGTTIYRGQDGFGNGWSANLAVASRFTFYIVNSSSSQVSLTSNSTVATNTWYHIVAVWTAGPGMRLYVNGVLDNSNTDTSTGLRRSTKGLQLLISNGSSSFNGLLDEVEISNAARSGDWIAAEYNNQNSPATFYSIGAALVNGSSGSSPYIAGLWPTIGPVTTPVQILGANFGASQGSSAVTFNGTAGAPLVWNDSAIYVRVPTGASTGNVAVTVAGAASNGLGFTVNTAPGIASIYPQSGLVGTQVLITGANFGATQQSSTVSMNGMNVPVMSWSGTSLLVVVPSGASSGPFVVSVGTQTGNSSVFTVSAVPTGWLQQDIGAVGIAGAGTFQNGAFTVTGAGQGIWNSADAMHFVYQPLSGDGYIVARVVSMPGGTTYEQAGVIIRETLNAGAASACVAYQANQNPPVKLFVRSSTGGNTSALTGNGNVSLPYWVKLVRSGNSFSAYMSLDGLNWAQVGSSQTITMAQSVYVGLGVSSDITSTSGTAVFDNVSVSSNSNPAPVINALSATTGSVGSQVVINGLNFGTSQGNSQVLLNGLATTINSWGATSTTITIPVGATSGPLVVSVGPSMNDSNPVEFEVTAQPLPAGLLDRDVGQTGTVGTATYSNGVFDVVSAGSIGGSVDSFHFIYQQLPGDGSIVARVAYLAGVGFPQIGVMIRETLGSGSANAFLFYQPNQAFMYSRASAGAGTTQQTAFLAGLLNGNYPYWVKLTRSGNTFSGYISMDGVYWTQIGTSLSITMAQNVYVGLVTSANNGGSTREAKFDNVSISTAGSPAPTITSISATTGAVGNQITIGGTGFGASQGAGAVYLNDAPMTINTWSATSISGTIPTGATTGHLGVSVSPGQNASNPFWFTVTSQPLPSGWLDRDIGQPGTIYPQGSATFSNGTLAVNTAGNGVLSPADAIHFVYQPLSSDGSMVARVTGMQGSQAGVMIRESLDPGSTSVFVDFAPNLAYLTYRITTNATATEQQTFLVAQAVPYWAKVTRSGNSFSGYISLDGVYWTQAGTTQTIPMASTVYIGVGTARGGSNGSLAAFTYDNTSLAAGPILPAPVVTSASPTVVGPGYSVTIVGSNFGDSQSASAVYFNGAAASSVTSWSSTQIIAVVPTTASSGPVTVVVAGVGSNRTVPITVYKPTITSLTPPAASTGGSVTLTGSGFGSTQGNSTVQFNGSTANASWSDSSITAVVPSSATSGPVTVTEGGIVSNSVQFTVLEPLAVSGISPTTGPVGTTVTIHGAGFGPTQSSSTVDFYGTPATVTGWSDTQITALVPVGAPSGSVDVTVAGIIAYGPNFTVTWSAMLTDSLGNSTQYASASIGGAWLPINSQGSGCSSCSLRGTIQNTYDSAGNVLTRTDELGRTTTYTYDTNNNVTSISVPIGNGTNALTSYAYNSFGEVLTTTDPLGNVTTNSYDTNGNLLTVTTPAPGTGASASVTHFAYDTKGELSTITDPLSNATTLTYTPAGLIATITDAQNNVTTYGYDTHGNRTSVTDALNHQTTFAYDTGDRLTTITYPGGTTTTFGYDYRGRRASVTDQNGKITTYAYDDADRLLTVTDAANNVTTYGYDTENNLTSIKDATNHTTTFAYDAFGRVTQTTFPSSAVETYSYDGVGNLQGKTDRKNQSITYTYDQLNRLTLKTYPDSSTVNYTYDKDSRLTQVSDPTGTYQFTFDNMGRLSTTTTQYSFLTSRTFSTAYSYDAASNRKGFTDPESGSTAYVYDTLNRLQTLTAPAAISGGSFGFGYDALSRRTSLTRPNAVNSAYGYDNLSRLLSVTHAKGGTTLDGVTYTVDNAGNRTAKGDLQAGVTTNYGYDAIYQLLSATQGGSTTETFNYDPVGNRLSSLGVASYSYNPSNELTSTSSTTYGYDNNGNTTSKTDSIGTTNYIWDFENRLSSATLPASGGTVSFKYDPFGRRIYKSSSSGTSIYAYDSDNLIEETNASGAVVARYSHTLGIDEPLAILRSGTSSFYNADGLGSVTSLCTATGALAQTYAYDSFGKQTTSSGSLTNSFQFTGREFDTETNLYYYRARYMDPSTGRFISEDPVNFSGGVDFYSYVGNSPVYWVDPLGLKEGSPSNLVKRGGIDNIARGLHGSQDYNFDKQKDNFPANTNKCNKFVCDVLNEAGTPLLVTPKGAAPRCARAGEIANPGWKPSCWRTLAVGEAPQPGDVAAFPLSGGGSAFSGHSGIITSDGNISAHANGVGQVPGQFGPNVPGIVFRRYICD